MGYPNWPWLKTEPAVSRAHQQGAVSVTWNVLCISGDPRHCTPEWEFGLSFPHRGSLYRNLWPCLSHKWTLPAVSFQQGQTEICLSVWLRTVHFLLTFDTFMSECSVSEQNQNHSINSFPLVRISHYKYSRILWRLLPLVILFESFHWWSDPMLRLQYVSDSPSAVVIQTHSR